MYDNITDVEGIRVGHSSDFDRLTGCTVILVDGGAIGGMDCRGSAAGMRQVNALDPLHQVPRVNAIFLAGGSAFGLDSAGGVMDYLEEKGEGFQTPVAKIPIVPTAILYDLSLGDPKGRPTRDMAYQACISAMKGEIPTGSIGAGTGASVGKLFGIQRAMKGGLGSASLKGTNGLIVGGLAVVNAFGDVVDPHKGYILAGARDSDSGKQLVDTAKMMKRGISRRSYPLENTTLAVVATNARLTKEEATKVAQLAQVGLAKTISPAHTIFDGDVIFVLSVGEVRVDLHQVGLLAQDVIQISIQRGVMEADGLGRLPAYKDLK
jgi:L-aminopeptidase/D-esterase-like protein